jgi:hypothetical protein
MSELREKVVFHYVLNKGAYADMVDAAIALIRNETLEEAAQFIEEHSPRYDDANRPFLIKRPLFDSIGRPYAAAIRGLVKPPTG